MRFARVVFSVAGVWGLLVLAPLYFMFDAVGQMYPPPVTHPDFYFGFIGVALAWQVAFLGIGRDPGRLRPMMVPAMLEKFGYVTRSSCCTRRDGCSSGSSRSPCPISSSESCSRLRS